MTPKAQAEQIMANTSEHWCYWCDMDRKTCSVCLHRITLIESALLAAKAEGLREAAWLLIETAPKGGGALRTDDPAWVEPPRILAWSRRVGLMIVGSR